MEDVQLDEITERSFPIEDHDKMKEKTYDENQGTHHTFDKPNYTKDHSQNYQADDKEKVRSNIKQ